MSVTDDDEEWIRGGEWGAYSKGTPLFRALKSKDHQWVTTVPLRALRYPSTSASLYNNMVRSGELRNISESVAVNDAGVLSTKAENGKFYCGLKVNYY